MQYNLERRCGCVRKLEGFCRSIASSSGVPVVMTRCWTGFLAADSFQTAHGGPSLRMRRNHYDLPHVGFGPFSLILVPRVGPREHTAAPPISCRRSNDMRHACSALRTGRWEPGTHGILQGLLTDTSRGTHGYSRADRRSIDWPQRTRRCGRPQEMSRTVGVCARREDSAVQMRRPRGGRSSLPPGPWMV